MRKVVSILIFGLLLAMLGVRIYQQLSSRSAVADSRGWPAAAPALLVNTAAVESHTFETTLEVLGELRPQAVVEVMSRISGHLRQLEVDRGDAVKTGQLLAAVDDADLLQQIDRAEAAVAVAGAAVRREEATRQNLQIQFERYRELQRDSLVSLQELQDLESRLRAAEAELELARAQVGQAEAALRGLRIQHRETRIYSPLNGYVGNRYVDPGALLNPSLPIVSVINIDRVKTVVPVMEEALTEIRPGLPARVGVDAYPGRHFAGSVSRISPVLNRETRSADVEIEVDNPDHTLKPGMFARVRIEARLRRPSLAIPRSALLTRGVEKGVFVLTDRQTVSFRPVQIGRIVGQMVELLGGAEQGEEVVASGAQSLNDGDLVRTE